MAECKLAIVYKSRISNRNAKFLSSFSHHDSADKAEEGALALVVAHEQSVLEPFMKLVKHFS